MWGIFHAQSPLMKGGLQGCDARTHHPSWSSIILKSTFSITRCCFFPWRICLELYWLYSVSWSYNFAVFFVLSKPYLRPKCYGCTWEEFMLGTLVLLWLFMFLTVTNQKMPYTTTCDDGGYVHSTLPYAVSAFLSQPSSFFSSQMNNKDWCHNHLDAEHLGHDLPCLDTTLGHQIISH